jgi:ubiquinone/menaquinone biosynthesis C-methylase UbiE
MENTKTGSSALQKNTSGTSDALIIENQFRQDNGFNLEIKSKTSLVHMGSLDSFDITPGGTEAAGNILDYLRSGKPEKLEKAIGIYDRLIPSENFGGEYTSLRWICKYFLAPDDQKPALLAHSLVASFYDLLAKNNFANLKEYLSRKYHFIEIDKEDAEARVKLRFLEDFMLFNNPDRERWDRTSDNINSLRLKEGDKVIDLGCGPGYFTFKFADIVGPRGHIYALETNERHLHFLRDYISKYDIKNVDIILAATDSINVDSTVKVDLIYMCSLYHVIYAANTDGERDLFIQSIKNCLKPDGRLVIIDNDLVEDGELPYHGPYISRDMITSQMWNFGFDLTAQYQFSPQRYVLEYQMSPVPRVSTRKDTDPPVEFIGDSSTLIKVTSASSLVRNRMIHISSQGYTLLGKRAARIFYRALETKDRELLLNTISNYNSLIPTERIGDEYSAFVWFCEYLLASEEDRGTMLASHFDFEYFDYLASNDFKMLKRYLSVKYDLDIQDPDEPSKDDPYASTKIHDIIYEYTGNQESFDQINEWSSFITGNNPRRNVWEKTDEILKFLNIKSGEHIADVGCGYGYYTNKFAEIVGDTGKVYAIDINKDVQRYVEKIRKKYNQSVETKRVRLNDIALDEASVDTVFLCSVYHSVYIASIEFVKDDFVSSIKMALKKSGRLVIVDNPIVAPSEVPFFGPCVAKELVIGQLKHYGFKLVDSAQFIPQRYVLVFQKEE